MHNPDIEYKVLKILEQDPKLTQRELANELGLSLGKTHYVIRALVDRGWLKLKNFRRSNHKAGYAYYLTKKGLVEKSYLGVTFLRRKQVEYDLLQKEIKELKLEVNPIENIDNEPSKKKVIK